MAQHPSTHGDVPIVDPKPPGGYLDEEQRAALRNTAALRPRQVLYLKIRGYAHVETGKSAAIMAAVDALEAACDDARAEISFDATLTPPTEADEKRTAERATKREAAKKKAAEEEAAEHAKMRAAVKAAG